MADYMQKLYSLGWIEWKTIFSSILWLPYTAWLLRIKGYKCTSQRFLSVHGEGSMLSPSEQVALARRIARAVDIAALHGPYRANCLKRSLVLVRLLSKQGIDCRVQLGVALKDRDFSAHAWVVSGNHVLNDRGDIGDDYREMKRRPEGLG